MVPSYSEQLKDSRWNNKRTEILIRDNFKCQHPGCGKTEFLQVHHKDYLPDKLAWEYPNDMLITLCNSHHKKEQSRDKSEESLLQSLKMKGFLSYDLLGLSCLIDTKPDLVEWLLNKIRK